MKKKDIYQQGKEKYSIAQIIAENVLIILHIFVGIYYMWDVKILNISILSIAYFLFLIYMLVLYLRKHVCTHCYYYGKGCHCGWGKLALLYKKERGNRQLGIKLAGATWGTLMGLPILVSIILIIVDFNMFRVIGLILLVVLLVIQGTIHKKDCESCKMKNICSSD